MENRFRYQNAIYVELEYEHDKFKYENILKILIQILMVYDCCLFSL